MRKFYLMHSISQSEKSQSLSDQFKLSWTHYINYYDRNIRLPEENKTIGIILCRDKNEAVVEYTLPENSKNIFASEYQTVLPNKKQLK